jgi:hypothetical protein
VEGKAMKTYQMVPVILALSLATSLCGAMGQVASAQPQQPSTAEQCEQATQKTRSAEASAIAAAQQARVAEEVAYQASQEAKSGEFRAREAEAVAEAARKRSEEAAEAFRRGYALAPDPSAAERDYAQRLTVRDQSRELAVDARARAADRRKDAETARNYAVQLSVAAEKLRQDAEDLCARQWAAEKE